ncbi:hypothetical protein [Actinomadura coerulea]
MNTPPVQPEPLQLSSPINRPQRIRPNTAHSEVAKRALDAPPEPCTMS